MNRGVYIACVSDVYQTSKKLNIVLRFMLLIFNIRAFQINLLNLESSVLSPTFPNKMNFNCIFLLIFIYNVSWQKLSLCFTKRMYFIANGEIITDNFLSCMFRNKLSSIERQSNDKLTLFITQWNDFFIGVFQLSEILFLK